MTEEQKVITIDDVEYTEDQLTDAAKACINHINSLDQKIGSAKFNLEQLQVGKACGQGILDIMSENLDKIVVHAVGSHNFRALLADFEYHSRCCFARSPAACAALLLLVSFSVLQQFPRIPI